MSQDLCEIFFSTVDPKITHTKVKKKLEALFKRKKLSIDDVFSGKKKNTKRDQVIQIASNEFGDVLEEVLQEGLNLINNLPCKNEPYASFYIDQAGETIFYALVDGKLRDFSSLEAIEEYFEDNPNQSPEELFFTEFAQENNVLLLRLKVPGKRVKQRIERLCLDYISDPKDQAFEDLKSCFDHLANHEIDFPHLDPKLKTHRGDIEIAKSLVFCRVEGHYIYLGFNSDNLLQSAHAVVYSGDYSEALNMLYSLSICQGIKDVRAKLWSNQKGSNKEWYMYEIPAAAFFCFEEEKSPARLWHG